MIYRLITLVIFSVLLSACSTVNRGATDHFRIDTVPQGAKVTTSIISHKGRTRAESRESKSQKIKSSDINYFGCEPTPCAIQLPRRSEFVAKLEHPGYEPAEIFIRSSTLKAGSTASAAANLTTASGSGFAIAGFFATIDAAFTGIFSLGTQTVNASGLASSGAAAGLGIGVGMIAIDIASGADLNLFPNPVVIELAESGRPVRKDPLVDLYWAMTEAKGTASNICKKRKKDRFENELSCVEARANYQQKRKTFQTLKKEQLDTFKASVKAARQKAKAAQ